MQRIRVVDSHTAGEPTRVVLEGGPDLRHGSLAERRDRFRDRYDRVRRGIVAEPRGSEALVGALLCEPDDPGSTAGVIFFNNVGYLGMCGHGAIGVIATLAYLGRIGTGAHRIDTPVGTVAATLHEDGRVSVANVPSYRWAAGVAVDVPGHGQVRGDVAWGGNWFFLVDDHGLDLDAEAIPRLTELSWRIRRALEQAGVTGEHDAPIDHVELVGPSPTPGVDGRSFVLCPGDAYDRSPCGTGTSAKLACLHADGKLAPGAPWRQESVLGSVFEARFTVDPDDPRRVRPEITGIAHVVAEATLLFDERDPLCWGVVDG